MRIINIINFLIFCMILTSCSQEKKEISKIKELNQKDEMILVYREGLVNLDKGDYFYSAKKFLEAEILMPQSDWAPKSALMASYAFYSQNYYSLAIENIQRYIITYPKNKNQAYARYLLAMCYYETIEGEKKDLAPLKLSKNEFENVIKNFPDTDYAYDSKFKIELINNVLASKDVYIGRHYIKKQKWVAALNRFKGVLQNYENTIYAEEALHRLVEIYYTLGMEDESKKYAILLGYNYQSSEWYKESYKIFNKDYEKKIMDLKKENKKKFKFTNKIKSLLKLDE